MVNWKEYEDEVFQECERVFRLQGAEVIKNAYLVGRYSGVKRQIDIIINGLKDGEIVSDCLVECKHYAQKINVKIVDSFIGCLEDVGVERGLLVSEKGFTKAAINRAHKGKENIEVDILSLGDLQQFQGYGAITYSGDNALIIAPPFGWIIDGKHRIDAPAVFYRRGLSFDEAMRKEKEWMYLQIGAKETETIDSIIEFQNSQLKKKDERAEIRQYEREGLTVREAFLPSYPNPEITVFREFDRFIAFLVLFCPECYIRRDTNKAISMLNKAVPMIMNKV
jgi:hypothetical protein